MKTNMTQKSIRYILTLALLTLTSVSSYAQDKSEDKDKDEKKEKPEVVAIVGGNIHTVSGPVVRKGTILIEDGKIKAVSYTHLTLPTKA